MENDELELDDDGFVPAANPTKEDYEALVSRNRKLFARIQKAKEKKAKEQDAPNANNAAPSNDDAAKKASDDSAWKERMELKTEGYNEDEIAFIQQSGGRKSLENQYVKQAIESMRAQKKAEAAAVETTAGKSEIEKQYTDEQLRNMSTAELEKILPKAQ